MSSSHIDLEEPLLRATTGSGSLSSAAGSLADHSGYTLPTQPSIISVQHSRALSLELGPVTPCTKHKFYWRYELTGPSFFKAIEEACCNEYTDHCALLSTLAQKVPNLDSWEARYKAFQSKITIHAVHFAASLGSTHVIEWIMKQCPRSNMHDRQACLTMGGQAQYHYTPLMCALFMSKTETAIWLLDQGASATIANADGLTACHLLAWVGLPYEIADRRLKALERVATKLVEKSANLTARSGELKHRFDQAAEKLRSKTPLDLAVGMGSSFPKQALHLLTESFHCPGQGRLFEDVRFVAVANPTGAEVLLEKMEARDSQGVDIQRDLRREVRGQVANGTHMDTFMQTLRMSPVAGVKMLELLLIEPQVTNPQRYPLPLYTVLPNGNMVCSYQPAEDRPLWEAKDGNKDAPPAWHSEFKKDLPANPLMQTDVYEVKIRVLHLPGIIKVQVLSILSMVKTEWHQMSIFGKMAVKAIIMCIWDRLFNSFVFSIAWEAMLLLVILAMGISPPSQDYPVAQRFMYSVIVAHFLLAGFEVLWGLYVFRSLTMLPLSAYMHYAKATIVCGIGLALIIRIDVPLQDGYQKTLVVINVFMRCFGLMFTCRVVPVVGPLIIAVKESFTPMRGMFLFMGMVFTTFSFAFIIFRDEGRSISFVLMYVYQGLVLADRDATQTIAGIDLSHEQTLDFEREMFTGGEDEWILAASSTVALFASSVFSLVLLNLTVGMYTNFYEQMEPLAKLMWQQRRAKQCVAIMLQPAWHFAALVQSLPSRNRGFVLLVAFASLLLFMLSVSRSSPSVLSGFLLAFLVELLQVILLVNVADITERNDYLWVSYRTDYAEEFRYEGDEKEIKHLRKALAEVRSSTCAEMAEIKQELAKVTKLLTVQPQRVARQARSMS